MIGCTTVETIEVKPSCAVPGMAALPVVESSQLETLDDSTYWTLMERERRLTDWALEMESVLLVLCSPS